MPRSSRLQTAHFNASSLETDMQKCKCRRCGHEWQTRVPWSRIKFGEKVKNHVPVRCASCRSKYWNRGYTRNISRDRMNPGSYFYTPPLALNLTGPCSVSRKQVPPDNSDKKKNDGNTSLALVNSAAKIISPVVNGAATVGNKQAPSGHRRRAGERPSKLKHGVYKGKK